MASRRLLKKSIWKKNQFSSCINPRVTSPNQLINLFISVFIHVGSNKVFKVPPHKRIEVQAGDILGWYRSPQRGKLAGEISSQAIPLDKTVHSVHKFNRVGSPVEGDWCVSVSFFYDEYFFLIKIRMTLSFVNSLSKLVRRRLVFKNFENIWEYYSLSYTKRSRKKVLIKVVEFGSGGV